MDSKLSPAQANPHHAGDVVVLTPKDWTDTEEVLSKLAHVASDRSRPAAGRDFSAGPRLTEPLPDSRPRGADMKDDLLSTNRPKVDKRTSRGLARFLQAACVGVAATLAWQSYGRQMIADSAPQLGWLLSPPAPNSPPGREIADEQPSPPAASTPNAASAQAEAVAKSAPEPVPSTAPTDPSPDLRELETMSRDLAVLRETVERLAAGQEQIARDIAKLQTEGQDIRRRMSALPPAAGGTTARKPVPPPQPAPHPQSSAGLPPPPVQPPPPSSSAQLSPALPPPPLSAAPLPPPPDQTLRPPMPVR
jgi:hypothetical protein